MWHQTTANIQNKISEMTTVEMIKVYIHQLCTQIGTSPDAVYSAEFNSWNFARGGQNVEIFFTSYETSVKTVRTFIRCFSAIYPLPQEPQKQLDLYRTAMENNTQFMGVKMGTIPAKGCRATRSLTTSRTTRHRSGCSSFSEHVID